MESKKAVSTLAMIAVIFLGVLLIIMLVILSYGAGLVDDSVSQINVNLGNVSFNETYGNQVRPAVIALETTIPRNVGIFTLMGMVLILFVIGIKMPAYSRLWVLFDIIVIIAAEIIAISLKTSFTEFMNSSPQINTILTTTMASSSTFILRLDIIVPIAGAIMMALTYMKSKRETKLEEVS